MAKQLILRRNSKTYKVFRNFDELLRRFTINRSDLTNYFLDKQPDILNRDQIEKIKAVHYDEVRFMSWALQKMKESKKNGETLSLKDLVQLSQASPNDDIKRTKKAKSAESNPSIPQNESIASEKMSLEESAKPDPS